MCFWFLRRNALKLNFFNTRRLRVACGCFLFEVKILLFFRHCNIMALMKHEIEIRTGRRDGDGQIRVSVFMDDLLALTLEGHGERAPTLLLTLEQARKLQTALAELTHRAEEAVREEKRKTETWRGEERRRMAS
jgi:hypothetical protein